MRPGGHRTILYSTWCPIGIYRVDDYGKRGSPPESAGVALNRCTQFWLIRQLMCCLGETRVGNHAFHMLEFPFADGSRNEVGRLRQQVPCLRKEHSGQRNAIFVSCLVPQLRPVHEERNIEYNHRAKN